MPDVPAPTENERDQSLEEGQDPQDSRSRSASISSDSPTAFERLTAALDFLSEIQTGELLCLTSKDRLKC